MIICTREESTTVPCMSEKFQVIMEKILSYDINQLAIGEYPIIEDKLILKVMERTLVSPEEKEYEVHEEYYDVHIPINGSETLGFATTPTTFDFIIPFDKSKDVGFVTVSGPQTNIDISNHDVVIIFPKEPHKPACTTGAPFNLKKAVVKIHHSLF